MSIEVGTVAPAFKLTDAHGTLISLADFKGKNVIVYFYPKDDTPGCTKQACGFRDNWSALEQKNVVVVGISADDAASHTKFAEKYQLPFILLSDPERKVMAAYGAYFEGKLSDYELPDEEIQKSLKALANFTKPKFA